MVGKQAGPNGNPVVYHLTGAVTNQIFQRRTIARFGILFGRNLNSEPAMIAESTFAHYTVRSINCRWLHDLVRIGPFQSHFSPTSAIGTTMAA